MLHHRRSLLLSMNYGETFRGLIQLQFACASSYSSTTSLKCTRKPYMWIRVYRQQHSKSPCKVKIVGLFNVFPYTPCLPVFGVCFFLSVQVTGSSRQRCIFLFPHFVFVSVKSVKGLCNQCLSSQPPRRSWCVDFAVKKAH